MVKVTMNDQHGDGSEHEACPQCHMCKDCMDCQTLGCGREKHHRDWLKERVELVFGKRCHIKDPDCHLCNAWSIYDYLVSDEGQE